MRLSLITMTILLPIVLTGCMFTGVSSEERLRDAVVGMNDETRWNRLDLATQRVAPAFRGEFRATHYNWHRNFQIADTEIVHVETSGEREHATSLVTVRWYHYRTMLLTSTTLRQEWEKVIGGYIMIGEEVAEGNEDLLEIPEMFRPDEDGEVEGSIGSGSDAASDALLDDDEPEVASR